MTESALGQMEVTGQMVELEDSVAGGSTDVPVEYACRGIRCATTCTTAVYRAETPIALIGPTNTTATDWILILLYE